MNINAFLGTLPIVAEGMLSIFLIVGVIYLAVLVTAKIFKK